MKSQDLLSVLITFVVGVFAGGYLYLNEAAPVLSKLSVPTVEKVSQFTVVGDVYGGCRDTCPSFQLVEDGTYRYLYTPAAGAEQVVRAGKLPRELHDRLRSTLITSALETQSSVIQPAICNSYTDGIDILYDITVDGKQYQLNSCGTAVKAEGGLWSALSSVWDYFETGNNF
jgi:hypothetical protein